MGSDIKYYLKITEKLADHQELKIPSRCVDKPTVDKRIRKDIFSQYSNRRNIRKPSFSQFDHVAYFYKLFINWTLLGHVTEIIVLRANGR
jgi:hypothetical protein